MCDEGKGFDTQRGKSLAFGEEEKESYKQKGFSIHKKDVSWCWDLNKKADKLKAGANDGRTGKVSHSRKSNESRKKKFLQI